MKSAETAGWVFAGLVLVASGAYAQEVEQKAPQSTKQKSHMSVEIEAREKPLRDAEALMNAGRPADAYNLLEPLEYDRSGEVRFDYLIGIAALDSGKPDKATLALERVLAVDPNYAGARLDMARAYYQLGDLPRAKTEFEAVLEQKPTEAARATIQKYLNAITVQLEFNQARFIAAKQTRFSAYVEGGLGYDTNVNNSTSQSQISVPYLNNAVFPLSPTNLKSADNYYSLATGGEVSHNLNANWSVYAGADARQRGNNTHTGFDTLSLDGQAGVAFTDRETNIFHIGAMGGRYNLARAPDHNFFGLSADWRHVYSPTNQVSIFAQYGHNRYVDPAMTINDFDQTALGTGWLHVLADGQSTLSGSLFLVNENDVAPITLTNPSGGRDDGDKLGLGLRAGGQTAMGENTELFVNLGLQSDAYDKTNASFLLKRKDHLFDMYMGANWHWDNNWTLRPKLSYSRNYSNIVIYSYNRTDVSLTIRRDFW
ncbi:MAG: tetratricopeptide repeat protein [Gallionella sp.]